MQGSDASLSNSLGLVWSPSQIHVRVRVGLTARMKVIARSKFCFRENLRAGISRFEFALALVEYVMHAKVEPPKPSRSKIQSISF